MCFDMDLIFVTDSPVSSKPLVHAAARAGHSVIRHIGPNEDASDYVLTLCPHAVIFITDEIDRTVLRQMQAVSDKRPTPMLVFTRDSSDESIDASVKAGASAYIVDCHDTSRINSLLRVSLTRFTEQQKVATELKQTRVALQDRKIVERAKGLIMQQRQVSEDQAYRALRKLAMDRNKRLGEIAVQVIEASEVLV
jgi:two-component system, response regulator / RNA-binding antiterminator